MSAKPLKLQILLNAVDRVTRPLQGIIGRSNKSAKALQAARQQLAALSKTQDAATRFKKLEETLDKTSHSLQTAQARARALGQAISQTTTPTRAMQQQFERAQRISARYQTTLEAKRARLAALRQTLTAAGFDTQRFGNAQEKLGTQMRSANNAITQQQNRLSQLAAMRRRVNGIKESLTTGKGHAVGAAAAGVAGVYTARRLLAPGLDFGAGVSRVQALTDLQKDSYQLIKLREQAKQLGSTTSFTATQAAEGQGYLAMAGFKPEQINSSMPSILAMARAGNVDLGRAADIGSDISSAFGIPAEQMQRVADVLTKTFTTSNTTLELLGESMKYVAPVARKAGMTIEQTSAMIGLLGNVGIKGSQAGTTMRNITTEFAASGSSARKALDELGITVVGQDGKIRNFIELFSELSQKLSTHGESEQMSYLRRIVGKEAFSGMSELQARAGLNDLAGFTDILNNSEGTAERIATIMENNALGDLKGLVSAWEGVSIELFEGNDKALRESIQNVTHLLRSLRDWVKENPELAAAMTKIVGAFALLNVTLLALKFLFGGLTMAIVKFGAMILATPIGWLLTAVTALGVGAYYLIKHWDKVKGFFRKFFHQVSETFSGFITRISDWFRALPERFINWGKAIIDHLVDGMASRFDVLKNKVTELARNLVRWFQAHFSLQKLFEKVTAVSQRLTGFARQKLSIDTGSGNSPLTSGILQQYSLLRKNSGGVSMQSNDTIHINVQAGQSTNPRSIAQAIAAEFARREKQKQAALRSTYFDTVLTP
jgi:TP901 family phage tail tape measure protein